MTASARPPPVYVSLSLSPAMAGCCCCCCSSSPPPHDGPEFKKRRSNLPSLYPLLNEHTVAFEDWSKQFEASERRLNRKQANCSSARSDLYQILGLFSVFQGVILTAVAQSNLLTCHNWILPFFLCLLTSIATFSACLQKLKEISKFTKQIRIERAQYIALDRSIDALREQGTHFDVHNGQPELQGPYPDREYSGKGTFDDLYSSFKRFCSVWIISSAGGVLLLLCLFSGLTLFAVHQILCNPGL